jgi:hypothetical protein
MRPVSVAEVLVLTQHDHQVTLVPDRRPVQEFSPAAADSALHDRIHPRCLDRRADDSGAGGPDTPSNAAVKLASRSCSTIFTRVPASSKSIRFLA